MLKSCQIENIDNMSTEVKKVNPNENTTTTVTKGTVQKTTTDQPQNVVANDQPVKVEQSKPDTIHNTNGTLYDQVNPPTKSTDENKIPNPTDEEQLKARIEAERAIGLGNARIQEEYAKKIRTEMQGFEYKLPDDLKNDPNTPDYMKVSGLPKKQNSNNLKG